MKYSYICVYLCCLILSSCSTLTKTSHPDADPSDLFNLVFDPYLYRDALQALSDKSRIQLIINHRSTPQVKQTIAGALVFLDDTQVKDRKGLHSSLYDYCGSDGESCEGRLLINRFDGKRYKQIRLNIDNFRIRNVLGEWATTIHFLPDKLGDNEGEAKVAVQDSNVFSTAAILYPLYFIDETSLPKNVRTITNMRSLAARSIARFKRGSSYNFWIELDGETSSHSKVGPFNIPVNVSERMGSIFTGALHRFWKYYTHDMDIGGDIWVRKVLDKEQNPFGFDAVFNIPNDADDTSIVVAIQKFHSAFQPNDGVVPDLDALETTTHFLDKARKKTDIRDYWRGAESSGAFLTWLKDENLGTFTFPEQGIITHGVNNIDCVVNSNVLFSLALNELQDWDGFEQAKILLVKTIEGRLWANTKCGLYYPQQMMFPYAVTRAFREGQFDTDRSMSNAMKLLLEDLIQKQNDNGSFSGGKDKTTHLSTALAINALINIGFDTAQQIGKAYQYQESLAKGISYIISQRMPHRIMFTDTFGGGANTGNSRLGYRWDSGLFFSSSFWDLVHWRSEAYTAAVCLEALIKYSLAYDMDNSTLLNGRRFSISNLEYPTLH